MTTLKRIAAALALPWRGPEAWRDAIRVGPGSGLARMLLAALLISLSMLWNGNRAYQDLLDEAPGMLAQLPRMGLRSGRIWTEPPLVEPRVVRDSAGREVLLLDLEGKIPLQTAQANVQLTRTRLLVRSHDGRVEAYPLAGTGLGDEELKPAELLAFLDGSGRWLALAVSAPFLFISSLGLLFLQQALLVLMSLVPERLHRVELSWSGRLRLISLAILGAAQPAALLLLAPPLPGPGWLPALVLSLAFLYRGLAALQDPASRTGSDH